MTNRDRRSELRQPYWSAQVVRAAHRKPRCTHVMDAVTVPTSRHRMVEDVASFDVRNVVIAVPAHDVHQPGQGGNRKAKARVTMPLTGAPSSTSSTDHRLPCRDQRKF